MCTSRGLLVGLMLLLMAGALAMTPTSASANYHYYCEQSLEPGGTCPPNGSSKWWHLEENLGWDPYGNHEVCVDDYLDPSGSGYYTEAKCIYEVGHYAESWPGGIWGYPRVWNGGTVTHTVIGEEQGFE
jgi:hypothetical protein